MGSHGRGLIIKPTGEIVDDGLVWLDRYVSPVPQLRREVLCLTVFVAVQGLMLFVAAMTGVSLT